MRRFLSCFRWYVRGLCAAELRRNLLYLCAYVADGWFGLSAMLQVCAIGLGGEGAVLGPLKRAVSGSRGACAVPGSELILD